MKLDELFKIYLEDINLTHQDTTIDAINYRYSSMIKKNFGDKDLNDISYIQIKKFQKDLLDGRYRNKYNKRYTINYINVIIQLLKNLMKYARVMQYTEFNPEDIRGLETIRDIVDKNNFRKRQVIWTLKDFNEFISYVDDIKYKLIFEVLFFCGLRRGEVLALRWENIDLIEGTITIDSTAGRKIGVGQIVKSPKTKNSYRTLYIHDSLKEEFVNYYAHVKYKNKISILDQYVFGGIKMVSFSTLDRQFRNYKEKSGMINMNIHGFRHSHATMMLELTNDVYNVSVRLGHESVEVTKLYLHSSIEAQKELASKIEKAINYGESINSYTDLIAKLEKILLQEITKSEYNGNEVNSILNIYEYIKHMNVKE